MSLAIVTLPMLKCLVTGSDTGVGKTFCTGQLAYDFAIQKKRIQIVKPVEIKLEVMI